MRFLLKLHVLLLTLKDVYIKHFYDLLVYYWHLADCRSIVVLAPLTPHYYLLNTNLKIFIEQFIKSNLCQLFLSRHTARTICLIRIAHSSVRQFEDDLLFGLKERHVAGNPKQNRLRRVTAFFCGGNIGLMGTKCQFRGRHQRYLQFRG